MSKFYIYLWIILLITSYFLVFTSYAEETGTSSKNTTIEEHVPEEATAIAPNVDLKEVAPLPEPVISQEPEEKTKDIDERSKDITVLDSGEVIKEEEKQKLIILGSEIPASTATRLAWSPQITIAGLKLPTPVLVINGENPGPVVCVTSAIHGDELNGIEVVRRVMYDIKPKKLSGTLIGVPIVNLQGFQRGSRYLSDRRDLNRHFPGEADGSLASRIAHSLFTKVISHCDYLIDIHTGSFRRTNLPQIRANMQIPEVAEFVENFDEIAVVHHPGNAGMLRTAANRAGVVAVTMELGKLEMYSRVFIWGDPEPAYYESVWLRVESGGILFSEMGLGQDVSEGDILGVVTDPITNLSTQIVSPINGHIIGMAVNQVVVPGFAAYHIGIKSTQEDMAKSESENNEIDMDVESGIADPE